MWRMIRYVRNVNNWNASFNSVTSKVQMYITFLPWPLSTAARGGDKNDAENYVVDMDFFQFFQSS